MNHGAAVSKGPEGALLPLTGLNTLLPCGSISHTQDKNFLLLYIFLSFAEIEDVQIIR